MGRYTRLARKGALTKDSAITSFSAVSNSTQQEVPNCEAWGIVDVFVAIFARKSFLSRHDVFELFKHVMSQGQISDESGGVQFSKFVHQTDRAWCEIGHWDALLTRRRKRFAGEIFVPRKPRMVAFRRGPLITATLTGLLPLELF